MSRTAFVEQSGKITPTHLAKWVTDGVITDGGTITSLNDVIVSGEVVSTTTRTLAVTTDIDPTVNGIQTYGYYTLGDGGAAFYTRTIGLTAGGFQSADGAYWQLSTNPFSVKMFGAKGDDSTDDTAAIQAAIDFGAGNTIAVFVPPGKYQVDPLTMRSDCILFGISGYGRFGNQGTNHSVLVARSNGGYILNGHNINLSCVDGIVFQGRGAGGDNGGYFIDGGTNSFWNAIRNCFFWAMDNEAIVDQTTQMTIENCLADSCMLQRTRASPAGVLTLKGTDAYVYNNEFSASIDPPVITNANLYCAAIALVGGGNNFISDTLAEFGETGFYLNSSTYNRLVNCRSDFSVGHGFVGTDQLSNCTAYASSQAGAGLYSGFFLNGGQGGMLNNCLAFGNSNIAYGFDDSTNYGDPVSRNIFNSCRAYGFTIAEFNPAPYAAFQQHFQPRNTPISASFHSGTSAKGATPNIEGCTIYDAGGQAGPVTITNFLGGFPGQTLAVFGDDTVTIANGGSIITNTFRNKLLGSGIIYFFKLYFDIWWEIPTLQAHGLGETVLNVTNPTGTVDRYTTAVIQAGGAPTTLTLPDPVLFEGMEITFKNTSGFIVASSLTNVVPLAGGAPGTIILAGTIGKWAMLKSDGTNWITMMAN